MIETIMGDNGTRFVIAAVAVAAGLLLLVLVLWFLKNRPSSTFIRGGKNRQPRLAVLDAAAVDTRRRLVLVRRDDVEHLIMIGGPTDIVIESRIGEDARRSETPVVAAAELAPANAPVVAQKAEPVQHRSEPILPKSEPVPIRIETPVVLRTEPRPEQRPDPKVEQQPAAKPVSAMAQVLYSDDETPRQPITETRRAGPSEGVVSAVGSQQRDARAQQQPATAPVGTGRQTVVQGPGLAAPVQSGAYQLRAMDASDTASPTLEAEDILDAARARVLPNHAAPMHSDAVPQRRPAAESQPVVARPATGSDAAPSDFERILDAEISGDLQRLAPQGERRADLAKEQGVRIEPPLTASSGDTRKEPTIEQEMARMLGEMSVSRNT